MKPPTTNQEELQQRNDGQLVSYDCLNTRHSVRKRVYGIPKLFFRNSSLKTVVFAIQLAFTMFAYACSQMLGYIGNFMTLVIQMNKGPNRIIKIIYI